MSISLSFFFQKLIFKNFWQHNQSFLLFPSPHASCLYFLSFPSLTNRSFWNSSSFQHGLNGKLKAYYSVLFLVNTVIDDVSYLVSLCTVRYASIVRGTSSQCPHLIWLSGKSCMDFGMCVSVVCAQRLVIRGAVPPFFILFWFFLVTPAWCWLTLP